MSDGVQEPQIDVSGDLNGGDSIEPYKPEISYSNSPSDHFEKENDDSPVTSHENNEPSSITTTSNAHEIFNSDLSSDSDDDLEKSLQEIKARLNTPIVTPTVPPPDKDFRSNIIAPIYSRQSNEKAKTLAEKLREKAAAVVRQKPTTTQSFVPSFQMVQTASDSSLQINFTPQQKRDILRKELMSKHREQLKKEFIDDDRDDIDEEFTDADDDEEEDQYSQDDDAGKEVEGHKELKDAIVTELAKEEDQAKAMTEEELEAMLTKKIIEMRFAEDYEEIKKIIQIITGQWRSGKLRHKNEDSVAQAIEGTEQERKQLEVSRQRRREREQRRVREREQETREIFSAASLNEMIERSMIIREGEREDARDSDIIRAQIARRRDNDPQKEILEQLEMKMFEREKKTEKEKRAAQRHKKIVACNVPEAGEVAALDLTLATKNLAQGGSYAYNISERANSNIAEADSGSDEEEDEDESDVDQLRDFLNQ